MDNDIIDISLDFDSFGNDSGNSNRIQSSTFGGGIELLMNEKRMESASANSGDIDIDDLNNLEDELNNLAQETSRPSSPNTKPTSFFGVKNNFDTGPSVHFDDSQPSVGTATLNTEGDHQHTWDGYAKFNNIPINPDRAPSHNDTKMSKEELLREKFKFLRKLEALEKKGVELTKKYSMESNLAEMQGEYEMIMEEKSKQNSVKFQGNMMMAVINGIEFLNNRFDPFDIKLEGWGEQLNENINDYDEIFGELHDKYKSKATLSPELKLLFQLGGSAMMVHMTNSMFKSSMPGMDDILKQNPDLMRQFQTAAVNSMAPNNPGFSGFMSGIMNPEPNVPMGSGPPPPMSTQGFNSVPPPSNRGGNNMGYNRPDLNSSMGRSSLAQDGISIRESFGSNTGPEVSNRSSRRPDMKGPSDITDILSGLKTRTININEPSQNASNTEYDTNNNSTISINDLKDLQSDVNLPKRSRRKPSSNKNAISLDLNL